MGELSGWVSNASQKGKQNFYSQVEHDSEQEDEASNSQIDPLHILQRTLIVANVIEDGIRSDDGRYNGSDTKMKLVTFEQRTM